jgi:hypothetical protein
MRTPSSRLNPSPERPSAAGRLTSGGVGEPKSEHGHSDAAAAPWLPSRNGREPPATKTTASFAPVATESTS